MSMSIAAVVIFGGIYLVLKGRDKPVAAEVFGILAVVAVIGVVASSLGWVDVGVQTTAPPGYTPGIPGDGTIGVYIPGDDQKIISSLAILTVDAGSGKRNVCEDQVLYFSEADDPRLSTSYELDTTVITAGDGAENDSKLKTNKLYNIIFHDTSGPTYYDGVLGSGVWDPSDAITSTTIKTTSATTDDTVSTSITFGEDGTAALWKIAAIPDILDETLVDGTINGQANVSGEAGSTNEVQVGTDSTPADDDTIYYNESIGDGSFYVRMTFGADGSQSYLKRPVLCFVNNMASPCEKNEFTAVTASLYTGSGSEVDLPSDLHPAFANMDSCIEIGGQSTDGVAYIESGKTATYTITFSVDEDYTESTDMFYIIQDDLADYNGQDIRQGMGATTVGKYVTIGFE